jgi:phosphatidylserine/phosphatidylglycerophosphate/cardiolipin synthase-like enzyme
LALPGCSEDAASAVSDVTESRAVRIVEVLSTPVEKSGAFVELRNDDDGDVSLAGWSLRFGSKSVRLETRAIGAAGRGPEAGVVPGHALALVVDSAMSDADVEQLACEAPIAVGKGKLGPAHAAADDVLATTLELQKRRHCVTVFSVAGLADKLAGVTEVALLEKSRKRDSARAPFGKSERGVSFERNGKKADAFVASPLGATAGRRNFWRSDPARLGDEDARAPIEARHSSPWRVGDRITALRREAAGNNGAAARALLDEAAAIEGGKLPDNPLIQPFDELALAAKRSAVGAFYQVNDSDVVEALAEARRGRGLDVRLVTDAEFKADKHYTHGFEELGKADVAIVFDEMNGKNRGPLMHDKFMVVDGEWVWTGSFNPIEDEPARIHADNVLVLGSRRLAELHQQEFETLFSGSFGIQKRGKGSGGAGAFVDGARVDVRFSPGLTDAQLKRRGAELLRSGDATAACRVVAPSNQKPVIEARYRDLEPCGGPYDLIVGEVARATSSVYFVAFSLALDDLADVMIERFHAGVDVKGVVDPTVATRGAPSKISAAGADVRATPNSDPACPAYVKPKTKCPRNPNKVWLHHKFVIVDYGTDHAAVITGSHNMSDGAELHNDEGLVVIRDRAVAEAYYRFFRETFDHPQTLGPDRKDDDLPALAISEVKPSADPGALQFVELANLGDEPVDLAGLSLWNRRARVTLGAASVEPGARAVLAFAGKPKVSAGVTVLPLEAEGDAPFVSPSTALVLRAADGRWIASYDPYTSEQNLPVGVEAGEAGEARELGFDRAALDALTVELLGVNATPEASAPTWSPRGFFSDWADEHTVTPSGLILARSALSAWTPAGAGTPGE